MAGAIDARRLVQLARDLVDETAHQQRAERHEERGVQDDEDDVRVVQSQPVDDWEQWQGPIARRPLDPARFFNWRSYSEYSGGIMADQRGAIPTVIAGGGLTVLAYLILSLGAVLGPAYSMLALLPAILLWGLASWGLMTAQQARLVALAPSLASVSLSLNSSAIYLGSATGAAVGALIIADGGVGRLGWVAAGFSVAALLAVQASGSPASHRA